MPNEHIWRRTSVASFAAFESGVGRVAISSDGTFWRRIRPFLYRPILPFQEFEAEAIRPPKSAWLGGFQHALSSPGRANSVLRLLVFDCVSNYSIDALDYNRKRQVRLAARRFQIKVVSDLEEFKCEAYPIYLSFFERTRYNYAAGRRDRTCFNAWADALFGLGSALVLGGYTDGRLAGVSISFLVDNTIVYATYFSDNQSLRLHLSDLMLHSVREKAARCVGANQIFSGMYRGGTGLDRFYLLRGCKVAEKPASLWLNPFAKAILKRLVPKRYLRLVGDKGERAAHAVRRPCANFL